ncbi:MAG TPA: hypothetical protein VHD89_02190 [Rhodanobacteraceae bacterium]|nr:hypothetical protein [Rhodanobacteraceae bacterium]
MRKVADLFFLPVLAGLLLSACGNADHPSLSQQSIPAPASTPANASSATAAVYAPASGAFAPESSAPPGNGARVVDDCNVDSVDGKPIDGASLARASTAEIAGWAADSATGTVPKRVRLVLLGVQGGGDFTMEIATGEARPDVAQAQKIPAFAASGWSVHADLSAVAPGKYDTVLRYRINGKPVTCDPHHIVTIR